MEGCDLYTRLLALDLRTTKAVDVSNAENLAAANKKKGRDMILIIRTEAPNEIARGRYLYTSQC